jgi:hypothetical protein
MYLFLFAHTLHACTEDDGATTGVFQLHVFDIYCAW